MLLATGHGAPLTAGAFVLGVLAYSLVAGLGWLVGQTIPRAAAVATAAIVAALTTVSVMVPAILPFTPWGWAGSLYPSTAAPWWVASGMLATAVVAVIAVPPILERLRGPELLAQARRWQTAGVFGAAGDLAGALAQFRPLPTWGRGWWAVRGTALPITFLVRDLIGSLRTPTRFAGAAIALAASGYLATVAYTTPGILAVTVAVASVLGYLALGVWSDGFRHAVEAASGPPLYGVHPGRLIALHAQLPVLAVLVFAGGGAGGAVATGAPLVGALLGLLVALFALTVRVYYASKGQMPLSLLAPVPSPAGDLSGLLILYWQADALIINSVAVTALGMLAAGAPLALLAFVPAGACVLLVSRRNLARR